MNDADPPMPMQDRAESPRPSRDGSGRRWSPVFLLATTIVVLLFFWIGLPFGYAGAIALTQGGFEAVLAAAVAAFIVGLIAAVLAIAGGVALAFKTTRPIGKISLAAAAAVVAGAVAAAVAVPALGLRYEPSPSVAPVYSTTDGTVRITLTGEPEFASDVAPATCAWATDGAGIESIQAADAGTLRGRTLIVLIQPGLEPGPEIDGRSIHFSIGADGVDDLGLPMWAGTVPLTSTDGGRAGSASFENFPIEPQKPEYLPDASWPQTLAGTLTWTCD